MVNPNGYNGKSHHSRTGEQFRDNVGKIEAGLAVTSIEGKLQDLPVCFTAAACSATFGASAPNCKEWKATIACVKESKDCGLEEIKTLGSVQERTCREEEVSGREVAVGGLVVPINFVLTI